MATRARKSDDKIKALVVATLKRAISVVEGSMVDKSTKPAEGAYPVAIELGIAGDITVGKATAPGEDREAPQYAAADVLAGLLAGKRGGAAKRRLLTTGLETAEALAAAGSLAAERKDMDESIASVSADLGLTKAVPTPGRAGAVSGKPSVTITGTHGDNTLDMEVKAA